MANLSRNFALRPLEIKHIFDFAVRLLRSGFAQMFLATAMVQLPLALMTMPLLLQLMQLTYELQAMSNEGNSDFINVSYWASKLDLAVFSFVMLFVALAYQVLVTPLGNLICARLAACRLLAVPCTFAEALEFARRRYWATQVSIAVFLLPLLLLSLVILVVVLLAQASGNDGAVLATAGLGTLLIVLGSLALLIYFCIYFPAVNGIVQASEELEGEGMLSQGMWSLRRAAALTKGHFWRMLGMLLFLSVIINYITRGLTDSMQLVLRLIALGGSGQGGEEMLRNLVTGTPHTWELGVLLVTATLFGLLFPPYWQCYKTLLYYDLRCRKEAFDLRRQLGLEGGLIDGEAPA